MDLILIILLLLQLLAFVQSTAKQTVKHGKVVL